ncbi:MAG: HK97 family phage prohead protease [Oscillospiraceae bacterium]|nr:HK97 family phage prohead protease [Oscillospiraceae bacterium]
MSMNIEIRADGAHISGYVNATEKMSRPVITRHGRVVEVIEPRAFAGAIARAGNITLTVDHDDGHVYAETRDGTLELHEDSIGLHADVLIRDENIIALARSGKIRGWSFGMYNVQDTLEPRAEDLPLRRIQTLDLDHVTLVVNKQPVYAATSVEVRADGEVELETRSCEADVRVRGSAPAAPIFDNSGYHARVSALNH